MLKALPLLKPTNNVKEEMLKLSIRERRPSIQDQA